MTTTTPTYTPLTDAELETLDGTLLRTYADASRIVNGRRAAAEIRALRAQRDDLLQTLRDIRDGYREGLCPKAAAHDTVSAVEAAIARAEGRAEG